jgi:putative protease
VIELLAPVGSPKKLHTALHFGADAVYFALKDFGLRAHAANFEHEEAREAVELCHARGKKAYAAVNIFAYNKDFGGLKEAIEHLKAIGIDALIISDPGVVSLAKSIAPEIDIHLSTQANTTNKYAAAFWRDMGLKRIILARECSLNDIREIKDFVGDTLELECFCHGAMCVSYSGRCLLSNYLEGRDANRGDCVQACRFNFQIVEKLRGGLPLTVEEDGRGAYILA